MRASDFVLVAASAALLGCGAAASAPSPARGAGTLDPRSHVPPGLQLPGQVEPIAYRVDLRLDPAERDFTGRIEIDLRVLSRSSAIWLHAYRLEVQRATAAIGGARFTLSVQRRDDDVIGLHAPVPLEGAVTLTLTYRGRQDDRGTAGLFRQRTGGDWYAFTLLEPVFARRVFPSIDEPARKTPWTISLEVPAGLTALANSRSTGEVPTGDGWKRVTFAKTRPLPPHVIALAVGPFDIAEVGGSRTGAPIRVVAPRGMRRRTALAAEALPRALAFLEDYVGAPYPYDKLDLVSIPISVGFICMENPGLVTCAEEVMLFEPATATPDDRRTITRFAAHELAHQWFGNLVTPAWWDDLWLNEGLATWIQDRVASALDPRPDDAFLAADNQLEALNLDRWSSVRAVRQPNASLDDIQDAFGRVTYSKAAAVIAMFERAVGADTFQRGIRSYVGRHADGVATAADFIAAISAAGGRDISGLQTFLDQKGAPRLNVDLRCGRAGTRPILAVRQVREDRPPAARRWSVPFCWSHDRDGKRRATCAVLEKDHALIALDTRSCPRWLVPHVAGVGHYELDMSPAMVDRALAGWSALTPVERVILARVVWTMARAEKVKVSVALGLIPRLLREDNRAALETALHLAAWRSDLPETHQAAYDRWMVETFGPEARRLGWLARPGEPLDHDRRRRAVLGRVAEAGDPVLVAESLKLAASWRDLPRGTRPWILASAIRADATGGLFDRLFAEVLVEEDRATRWELLFALVATRDSPRIARLLGLLLDPRIDIRETVWVPGDFWREPERTQAEAFVRTNLAAILARLSRDSHFAAISPLVGVFTSACDEERRDEITTFVRATFSKFPGAARQVEKALRGMAGCTGRKGRFGQRVARWLDDELAKAPR